MLSVENLHRDVAGPLMDLYGIEIGPIEELWNNENLVLGAGGNVVRIAPPRHRNSDQLTAELELLSVLKEKWCSVAEIIASNRWNSFEDFVWQDWGFFMTVFNRIRWVDSSVTDSVERWRMVREWWKTMWKIHRVTSEATMIHSYNRQNWDKEFIIHKADELLPDHEWDILGELRLIMDGTKSFPVNRDTYWLVHTDMRPRNFGYNEGKVVHFDFDDICHHWFMYDLAVAAFHETEDYPNATERTNFLKSFLKEILAWYTQEKTLTKDMLDSFVLLMRLRCIYAYINYYERIKLKNVDSGKERMLVRRNYVLDFDKFINVSEIESELGTYL